MADFKTHITTSSLLGVAYGGAGYFALDIPLVPCMIGTGLCSLSGMLPDLDADTGIPVRETVCFSAALIPMLMIDRFQHMGLDTESIILAGGIIYIIVRFGIAELFKRYTVHRGMWHSIPAAFMAALLAFLICSCDDMKMRAFKSIAVFIGFMSHLVLDEVYSVDLNGAIPRLKKSSGTAMKLWSKNAWANISTYSKLIVIMFIAFHDPLMMESFGDEHHELPSTTNEFWKDIQAHTETIWR